MINFRKKSQAKADQQMAYTGLNPSNWLPTPRSRSLKGHNFPRFRPPSTAPELQTQTIKSQGILKYSALDMISGMDIYDTVIFIGTCIGAGPKLKLHGNYHNKDFSGWIL